MIDLDRVHCIDVLDGLKKLNSESIDCVITSPPYWGLRDYGTAKWEGGKKECNHLMPLQTTRGGNKSTLTRVGARDCVNKNTTKTHESQYKKICAKCGAKRIDNQIGLEKTPEEYVNNLVVIFREVKRVLKKSGTVWLNLGDSYAGGGRGWEYCDPNGKQLTNKGTIGVEKSIVPSGLKHKDLVGIPWKVAFALQSDGWYLRQDIIWYKPNSMPESVTDRCTKSHEYVFLLSKSKNYFFDAESIKEPVAKTTIIRSRSSNNADRRKDGGSAENQCGLTPEQQDKYYSTITEDSTRNKRSVWVINTQPLKEAHFATFPPDLIEPMIKAGCPSNVCKKCGKPQVRIKKRVGYINDAPVGVIKINDKPYSVQERTGYVFIRDLPSLVEIKKYLNHWRKQKKLSVDEIEEQLHSQAPHHWFSGESYPSKDDWLEIKKLLGFDDTYDKRMLDGMYKPAEKLTGKYKDEIISCGCDAGFDGGVVMDPFMGSGTTGIVARKLLRHYIGFDLNPEYVKMAKKRLSAIPERLECFGDFVNK